MPNLAEPEDVISLADKMADRLDALCSSVERWQQSAMAGQLTSLYLIAEGARAALTLYRAAREAGIVRGGSKELG